MRKAILIARVSTLRQENEGLSLGDIQLPAMRKYASDNHFLITKEFVFSETADQKIRKKFDEVISYIKKHTSIDIILTFRVDRATRNYRDAVLFDDLRSLYNKELHFVNDRLILTNKSVGRDLTEWDTKVYLAKTYLNRLKEDAINTANAKLSKGELPGKAPKGYRNVTLETKRKWVEPSHNNEMLAVIKIFNLYSTSCYSMSELSEEVKKSGIKWGKNQISNILNNPFYGGMIKYDGLLYPHNYECIVAYDIYKKAENLLLKHQEKIMPKYNTLKYTYKGLFTCNTCGCSMTPERHKGHVYYHCTGARGKHNAPYVKEELIEKQVLNFLDRIKLDEEDIADLKRLLKESHESQVIFSKKYQSELQAQFTKLENRINTLYDDKLDGNIDNDMYRKKYNEFREKQNEIQKRLKGLKSADDKYFDQCIKIIDFAQNAKEIFTSSKPDEKARMLKILLQNFSVDGEKVRLTLQKPFSVFYKYRERPGWQGVLDYFRTNIMIINKIYIEIVMKSL